MELVTLLTHVHTSCQLGSLTEWVSSPSYEFRQDDYPDAGCKGEK